MGVTIAISNQKGGVGKTITVSALAYILHNKGYKVLSVNTDPQRNLDMLAGKNVAIKRGDLTSLSILNVLNGECSIKDAIVKTEIGDLVRASNLLSGWTGLKAKPQIEHKEPNEFYQSYRCDTEDKIKTGRDGWTLKEALDDVKDDYDYILIDTSPSLNSPVTCNSLIACDYVLIPVFAENASQDAVSELWDSLQEILYYNRDKQIQIAGLLMTNCKPRTISYRRFSKIFDAVANAIGTIRFDTKIRYSIQATECMETGHNIVKYNPKGTTAQDYVQFTEEFIKRINDLESEKNKQLV